MLTVTFRQSMFQICTKLQQHVHSLTQPKAKLKKSKILLRQQLIQEAHAVLYACHFGIAKTIYRLREQCLILRFEGLTLFAAGGSRMGAATITNATHDGVGTSSSSSSGPGNAGSDTSVVDPPAFLTSPLAMMDNTDG